jgi:SAM-dependent methyltransferase
MGRFETTVPFYARYREPYPAVFFSAVAERLGFRGDEKLLDVGCGPGLLAVGFAPFVGSCTGVDPEPAMLAAARAAAQAAGVELRLIEARVEDLPAGIGAFDLVTIGRALHWLNREATLQVLNRIVAADGAVLSCGTRTSGSDLNPWAKPYEAVTRAWASEPDDQLYRRRYHIDHAAWFAGSRFQMVEEIKLTYRHRVTIADLVGRALSKSTTSPEVLGDRRAAFEDAIGKALEPFAVEGVLDEEVEPVATVMKQAAFGDNCRGPDRL